jgi:hypothetical protein
MSGEFDDAIAFVRPLGVVTDAREDHSKAVFLLLRAKFEELVAEGGDPAVLVAILKEMEHLGGCCSKEDFNELCVLLTLDTIHAHPGYKSWSAYKGRLRCFESLRPIIEDLLPPQPGLDSGLDAMQPGRLVELLRQAALHQLAVAVREGGDPAPVLPNPLPFSLLRDMAVATQELVDPSAVRVVSRTDKPVHTVYSSVDMGHARLPGTPSTSTTRTVVPQPFVPGPPSQPLHRGAEAYDPASIHCCASVEDPLAVRCVAFSPDGEYYAVGSNSKTLRVFRTFHPVPESRTTASKLMLMRTNHHLGSLYAVSFNATGKVIATCSNDRTVKLIHLRDDFECEPGLDLVVEANPAGTVRDVQFNPVNHTMATCGDGDNRVVLWDAATGLRTQLLEIPEGAGTAERGMACVRFSHTSPHLLSAAGDCGVVALWDTRVAAQAAIRCFRPGSAAAAVSLSGSGALLAAGLLDSRVLLYDLRAGALLSTLTHHTQDCRGLEFSPASHWLLTASYDKTMGIAPLTDPQNCHVVMGHHNKVLQARWHPQGKPYILSSSADKSARLWAMGLQ